MEKMRDVILCSGNAVSFRNEPFLNLFLKNEKDTKKIYKGRLIIDVLCLDNYE